MTLTRDGLEIVHDEFGVRCVVPSDEDQETVQDWLHDPSDEWYIPRRFPVSADEIKVNAAVVAKELAWVDAQIGSRADPRIAEAEIIILAVYLNAPRLLHDETYSCGQVKPYFSTRNHLAVLDALLVVNDPSDVAHFIERMGTLERTDIVEPVDDFVERIRTFRDLDSLSPESLGGELKHAYRALCVYSGFVAGKDAAKQFLLGFEVPYKDRM